MRTLPSGTQVMARGSADPGSGGITPCNPRSMTRCTGRRNGSPFDTSRDTGTQGEQQTPWRTRGQTQQTAKPVVGSSGQSKYPELLTLFALPAFKVKAARQHGEGLVPTQYQETPPEPRDWQGRAAAQGASYADTRVLLVSKRYMPTCGGLAAAYNNPLGTSALVMLLPKSLVPITRVNAWLLDLD